MQICRFPMYLNCFPHKQGRIPSSWLKNHFFCSAFLKFMSTQEHWFSNHCALFLLYINALPWGHPKKHIYMHVHMCVCVHSSLITSYKRWIALISHATAQRLHCAFWLINIFSTEVLEFITSTEIPEPAVDCIEKYVKSEAHK